MEAGKATRKPASAVSWSRGWSLLGPLRAVWWLFTNVRFAMLLLAALALVSLLGVVIPQVPASVRGDAVGEADWLRTQHDKFGFLSSAIDRLGLFDVFHAGWFAVLMALTVASTGAYILSRFPGIWHNVTRPRTRVPDRYFQMAPNRIEAQGDIDTDALAAVLRSKHYRVELTEEEGTTYLFADRFQWAQLGTLLTHAAVIVFILSAVVSRMDAYSAPLFLSEGNTLPVFPVKNAQQIQVQLVAAHASFAPDGEPLDFRSDLLIYDRGHEVMRCTSTVNSPCAYHGYHFYQSAYFGYGAEVQVRDVSTGHIVYRETLALAGKTFAPHLVVRGQSGATLLDESIALPEQARAGGHTYRAALVRLSDGRTLTLWLPQDNGDGRLLVFEPSSQPNAVSGSLKPGQSISDGGLAITYVSLDTTPTGDVADLPLPGGSGSAQLTMTNVVYGADKTSAGTTVGSAAASAPPQLTLTGVGPQAVTLDAGKGFTAGGYEYTFLGQRAFAGITAKRDPSDTLVWIGAGLIVIGLMITFWVPRRRLWAKIVGTSIYLAGQAPSHAGYTRELRQLARLAGGQTPDTGGGDDD